MVATAARFPSTPLTLPTEEEEPELVGHPVKAALGRIDDHLATEEEEPELVVPRPAPSLPELNLDDLYKEGVTARAEGDLERVVVLWQQVLDRDPNFRNGTLALQMKKLADELQAVRVPRLRQRAQQAGQAGEWGQEIGAWKALLELKPQDEQARRRLALAKHNQKYASYYKDAQQFVEKGMVPSAKEQLKILWSDAPYYGDPARLATRLRIKGEIQDPNSYDKKVEEEARARARAEARARARAEEKARAARSKTHQGFIRELLETNHFYVRICLFCLLSGLGSIVGMLTHSTQIWPWITIWTVGTVACGALLAYILGYHRTMNVSMLIGIAIISGAVAFGLGAFASTLNYGMRHTSQLWLIGTRVLFIGRQINFGLIIGVIASVSLFFSVESNRRVFEAKVLFGALGGAIIGLIVWFIIALVGAIFGFGFGFGEGWYVGLLTLAIGIVGGLGASASVFLCNKAFKALRNNERNSEGTPII
mgnify:CR=1 FL=1